MVHPADELDIVLGLLAAMVEAAGQPAEYQDDGNRSTANDPNPMGSESGCHGQRLVATLTTPRVPATVLKMIVVGGKEKQYST